MYQNEAQLLKAPTKEPIHLEEAKLHRRVDSSDEDEFIKACITAARFHAEAITWRKYVLSTYVQHFDIFPKKIKLHHPPVKQVVSVKYIDSNNAIQTLPTSAYHVDLHSEPACIEPANGYSWPGVKDRLNAVFVEYKAGYLVPVEVDATSNTLNNADHPFNDGDVVQISISGGSTKSAPSGLAENANYYVVNASSSGVSLSTSAGGGAIDIDNVGVGDVFLGIIPASDRIAMLLLAGHFFENREQVMTAYTDVEAIQLPFGATELLMSNSVRSC